MIIFSKKKNYCEKRDFSCFWGVKIMAQIFFSKKIKKNEQREVAGIALTSLQRCAKSLKKALWRPFLA